MLTTKYNGQSGEFDDLKTGTPSVFQVNDMFCGLDKTWMLRQFLAKFAMAYIAYATAFFVTIMSVLDILQKP